MGQVRDFQRIVPCPVFHTMDAAAAASSHAPAVLDGGHAALQGREQSAGLPASDIVCRSHVRLLRRPVCLRALPRPPPAAPTACCVP